MYKSPEKIIKYLDNKSKRAEEELDTLEVQFENDPDKDYFLPEIAYREAIITVCKDTVAFIMGGKEG